MLWERDLMSWERDKYFFFTCPLSAAVEKPSFCLTFLKKIFGLLGKPPSPGGGGVL